MFAWGLAPKIVINNSFLVVVLEMSDAFEPSCWPGFNKGTGSGLFTLPFKSQRVLALFFLWDSISCTPNVLFFRFTVNTWQN